MIKSEKSATDKKKQQQNLVSKKKIVVGEKHDDVKYINTYSVTATGLEEKKIKNIVISYAVNISLISYLIKLSSIVNN
jgi:hypothetical protein